MARAALSRIAELSLRADAFRLAHLIALRRRGISVVVEAVVDAGVDAALLEAGAEARRDRATRGHDDRALAARRQWTIRPAVEVGAAGAGDGRERNRRAGGEGLAAVTAAGYPGGLAGHRAGATILGLFGRGERV